jgi:hypothetical protein
MSAAEQAAIRGVGPGALKNELAQIADQAAALRNRAAKTSGH